MTASKKGVLITDLDHSDTQIPVPDEHFHSSRASHGKKHLSKLSGNFPIRSRSTEWNPKKNQSSSDFQSILQTKDNQMESLVQKILLLYKYNNQFAKENKKLHILLQRSAYPKECETCSQITLENKNLQEINNNLKNDVDMMKVLVFRLNVQIESYQEKHRHAENEDICSHKEINEHDYKHRWGPVNANTLGPLLNSYEEMIRDKDDLIQQHGKELKHFTGELKQIIEENTRLHEEYDLIKKSSTGYLEIKMRLQSQVELLKSKLDVQTRRADLAKEKLLEVIQCYEQKTQTLSLDLEHLQNAYSRCKRELVGFKSSNTNQPYAIADSLKECKQLFEELKSKHVIEKSELVSNSDQLRKENLELQLKCNELKTDQEALKNELNSQRNTFEELKRRTISLQRISEKLKKSRDRLKARLKMALQWAQKLEQENVRYESTWDSVKRLETIVKHKEAQLKGLHSRHLEEMENMKQKLQQRDDTIKNILKSNIST